MNGRRLRIHGRVQGVFFRAWTAEQARELGLTGWVRNRRDGSVELIAFGEQGALDALIHRCGRGPSGARVERFEVEVTEGDPPPGFGIAADA